jgi:dTMP kinase
LSVGWTRARQGGRDIQQPAPRPELRVLDPEDRVSYLSLLARGNFLRFFLSQVVSSLGDWVGVIAIAIYAEKLGGAGGVGIVMAARVLPGFIVGPTAGVLADRWDRKRIMVFAHAARALLVFTLPFVPNLVYLLLVSALLESLTLIWGPAKDASLPHFVSPAELTHANSLSLFAVYGPWPIATLVYTLLSFVGEFLARQSPALRGLDDSPEALALWMGAGTFALSAALISTLDIPSADRREGRLDLRAAWRDLVEGLRFVRDHRQVRPWLLGIAGTFTAAGAVFSLGIGFVHDVLNAGDRAFALIIGAFATGMILGLFASGILTRWIQRDVMFSSSVILLGSGFVALASVGRLNGAVPLAAGLGFFAGTGYSVGYVLLQETTDDHLRGRTFSAAYTVIRLGTLVGLSLFPAIAEVIGDHRIGDYPLPGTRLTLWAAGLVVLVGGVRSIRAIHAGRALAARVERPHAGCFIVFEGGEGAGKSTQMAALVGWLEARGERVVTTREPGGTNIGVRIRELVLDPEVDSMDARTEALLYAADRAQHVSEVVKPALDAGAVVVSDRFVDSSLAYQGLARGLGLDEIYGISRWATGDVLPDLVLFLHVDSDDAFARLDDHRDRIEREDDDFHHRVAAAYLELAQRFPERFAVVDASRPPADVHRDVVGIVEARVFASTQWRGPGDLRAAGAPVPE